MDKKYLYIGGILVFVLFLFTFLVLFPNLQTKKTDQSLNTNPFTEQDNNNEETSNKEESDSVLGDPNNLTQQMLYNQVLAVPDVNTNPVKFNNGKAMWDLSPALRGNATFGTNHVQISTDEGFNLINDIYVNTGGSGVFAYVALYRYFADATVLSSFDFLDDRVKVGTISVSTNQAPNGEYTVQVSYLTRDENSALVDEPTVPVVVNYNVSNHTLARVED